MHIDHGNRLLKQKKYALYNNWGATLFSRFHRSDMDRKIEVQSAKLEVWDSTFSFAPPPVIGGLFFPSIITI